MILQLKGNKYDIFISYTPNGRYFTGRYCIYHYLLFKDNIKYEKVPVFQR